MRDRSDHRSKVVVARNSFNHTQLSGAVWSCYQCLRYLCSRTEIIWRLRQGKSSMWLERQGQGRLWCGNGAFVLVTFRQAISILCVCDCAVGSDTVKHSKPAMCQSIITYCPPLGVTTVDGRSWTLYDSLVGEPPSRARLVRIITWAKTAKNYAQCVRSSDSPSHFASTIEQPTTTTIFTQRSRKYRQHAYLRRYLLWHENLPGQGQSITHATELQRRGIGTNYGCEGLQEQMLTVEWTYRASSTSEVTARSSDSRMERPNLSSFSERTPEE